MFPGRPFPRVSAPPTQLQNGFNPNNIATPTTTMFTSAMPPTMPPGPGGQPFYQQQQQQFQPPQFSSPYPQYNPQLQMQQSTSGSINSSASTPLSTSHAFAPPPPLAAAGAPPPLSHTGGPHHPSTPTAASHANFAPQSYTHTLGPATTATTSGFVQQPWQTKLSNSIDLMKDEININFPDSWLPSNTTQRDPDAPYFGVRETPSSAMSSCLLKMPRNCKIMQKSQLPLGIHTQPLIPIDTRNIAIVQPREIVRCSRCRSYLNPYVRWLYGNGTSASDQWECSVCFAINHLKVALEEGSQCASLHYASIDYAAPADYVQTIPKAVVYVFLLDVSELAVNSGYLSLVCARLLTILRGNKTNESSTSPSSTTASTPSLPGDKRTRVALLTFDSTIHFYRLDGNAPFCLECADIQEPYLPCSEGLLCNLLSCQNTLEYLLETLPLLWNTKKRTTPSNGNALGAALLSSLLLLEGCGGRLFVFNCGLPTKQPGSLAHREDPCRSSHSNKSSSNVDSQLLAPGTDFYKQLSLEFSTKQICVNLFCPTGDHCDLVTLSALSRFTGGALYHYANFRLEPQTVDEWIEVMSKSPSPLAINSSCLAVAHRLWSDLGRILLSTNVALDAVMRLRCPPEISIRAFFGNTFVRSVDLLSLPVINEDSAFSVHLEIQQDFPANLSGVCLQVALLYSSLWGERRLRVHTIRLDLVDYIEQVFQHANGLSIAVLLTRFACSRSLNEATLTKSKEILLSTLSCIYQAYGQHVCINQERQSLAATNCLLAPTSLQLLALHCHALLRSKAFRSNAPGRVITMDERVACLSQLLCRGLLTTLLNLYPQFAIVDFSQNSSSSSSSLMNHQICRLSTQYLSRDGIFLLYTGDLCYLMIRRAVSSELLMNLFNISDFSQLMECSTLNGHLLFNDNHQHPMAIALLNIIHAINTNGSPCILLRDDTNSKDEFLSFISDHQKSESSMSYPELLQCIRSMVKFQLN